MLSTPFTNNCGGNRLNQWSVTIQVMFEKFNNGFTPILSTSNQSDTDAILFVDNKGKLIIPNSISSLGNNSATIVTNKWSIITLVVDSFEGEIILYINGENKGRYTSSSNSDWNRLDGSISINGDISIFGSKDLSICQGGSIRYVLFQPKFILEHEVNEIALQLKQEAQSGINALIIEQLISMGYTHDVAEFAANMGDNSNNIVENRVEAALNFLTGSM
jgi:hypothetical protein